MQKLIMVLCAILLLFFVSPTNAQPLRLGIAGLTHGHVHGILGREIKGDVEIVGIAEGNQVLASKMAEDYHLPASIFYSSVDEMIAATHPEAVAAFGSIYEHLAVVEACAPAGIHVMVEKPLAVNMEHALKMKALTEKFNIHLLTNYETTWYPSNQHVYALLKSDSIGDVRKIIVRDGHKGPKKIGVSPEFLDWLTDPVLNGGGAIVDFGCYGANLTTWLMEGKRPHSVTAITQQLQPENNPEVDDESIIILAYENANAIIQGSWNWPIGRKDMEVYGVKGALYADNKTDSRLRISEGYDGFRQKEYSSKEREAPFNDPFAFFEAVLHNKISLAPYDLSSLENNLLVVEILDAARESAKTGRKVYL
ncbi:MAG: Gfo/Idh/MocA family oxidoreductase [Lentimicrobium sp.]|jgi:predicted dehydrogenase|nr:Gfo/Idh/MocA family oxidoreductase [Lentimicrobium sp.]